MSQTILITITSPNSNVGPFNLYSCTGSTCSVTPFEYNLSRAILIAGYTSTLVPDGTTSIKINSTGFCDNYIDVVISGTSPTPSQTPTPTTTQTPTTTPIPTTTQTPTPTTTNFVYYFDVYELNVVGTICNRVGPILVMKSLVLIAETYVCGNNGIDNKVYEIISTSISTSETVTYNNVSNNNCDLIVC